MMMMAKGDPVAPVLQQQPPGAAIVAPLAQDQEEAMMSGRWIAAALVAVLFGATAPVPAVAVEREYEEAESERMVPDLGLRVRQIAGATLYTDEGDAIGEIEAVLVTQDGQLAGIGVEVGGFLGLGERDVLLRFDQVRRQGNKIVTLLSRAQLEAQPEWDD
jgi:hypothetical protein